MAETILPVLEMKRTWKITNVSMCPLGIFLTSPTFTFDQGSFPDDVKANRKWRLRLRIGDPEKKSVHQRERVELRIGVEEGQEFSGAFTAYLANTPNDWEKRLSSVFIIPGRICSEKHGIYHEYVNTSWKTTTSLYSSVVAADDSITLVLHVKKLAQAIEGSEIQYDAKTIQSIQDAKDGKEEKAPSSSLSSLPSSASGESLLAKDLGRLLLSSEQSPWKHDIFLSCPDGSKLGAHRCILAARSPVFKSMINMPMLENQESLIQLDSYCTVTLQALLHYLYTGQHHLKQVFVEAGTTITTITQVRSSTSQQQPRSLDEETDSKSSTQTSTPSSSDSSTSATATQAITTTHTATDIYLQLLSAAHQYCLPELVGQCVEYFQQGNKIDAQNVADLLNASDLYQLPTLQHSVHQYFLNKPSRLQEFLGGDTWKQLSPQAFRDLMAEVCTEQQQKKRAANEALLDSVKRARLS